MEHLQQTISIAAPISSVFHFHNNTDNLLKITPPNVRVSIETRGEPGLGYEVTLKVRQFGVFSTRWHVKITEYEEPTRMVDVQIKGPFRYWKQTRIFSQTETGTNLTDIVQWESPLGILGRIADAVVVRKLIANMFRYRQQATKRLLESETLHNA